MKKFVLAIACLLLNQFLAGQTYYPFPTDSAVWSVEHYVYGNFPYTDDECIAVHYGMVGDTNFGNFTYSKLYANNLPADHPYSDTAFNYPTATYVAAVREDSSRKVWVRDKGDTLDILYYDYALDSGDTFCFDYFGVGCYPVVAVDSIMIGGSYRRQIHFQPFNSETWIEGIGSTTGWFAWQFTGTYSWQLLCFQENQTQLYSPNQYCHCDTYIGMGVADQVDDGGVELYPNPATHSFTLNSQQPLNGASSIRIHSVTGKLMHSATVFSQKSVVDIDLLPPGLYFVTVENQLGQKSTRRLIKSAK